jgi:hypothetical protein
MSEVIPLSVEPLFAISTHYPERTALFRNIGQTCDGFELKTSGGNGNSSVGLLVRRLRTRSYSRKSQEGQNAQVYANGQFLEFSRRAEIRLQSVGQQF